ncbi:MAG: dTDP-4-dehydrorhamnose reductase [Actinomycetota bacterium]
MGRNSGLVVTGGQGQLGRALQALAGEAIFIDRTVVDLSRPAAVRQAVAELCPEVIIHAGAYTAVDAAEADPQGAWAVNVEGTRALCQVASQAGALLVYVSTDYVFAGDRCQPYPEDHRAGPLSVYGASKRAGEQAVGALERHLIVRTSWVFGEGHNFIRSILRAAPGRGELSVVDDQWGRPTYAPDLAAAMLALVRHGARGTFHLQGGGEPATWAHVAQAALAAAGMSTRVRPVSTEEYNSTRSGGRPIAPRPAYGVLDCTKAAGLGVALRPWRDAVGEYVKVGA